MPMRRLLHSFGALVVLTGALTAGSAALMSGAADAGTCGTPTTSNCTMTGTVTLTAGSLSLTAPGSLSWTGAVTGLAQSIVDTTAGDQQYTVNDATGTGAGWHVTTAATTFTNATSATFPNIGTFVTNGSLTSVTSMSAPTATCSSTCTLPTDTTTYPVAITTAPATPTPSTIYDASASTGLGSIIIGGSTAANPVGWWVNVPGSATSTSAYTSTITMAIISGP
jgi:WxL domain surface cell wall-binding